MGILNGSIFDATIRILTLCCVDYFASFLAV